jgi:hypothetical protein
MGTPSQHDLCVRRPGSTFFGVPFWHVRFGLVF